MGIFITMKIALQQYKPSPWQYAIGCINLLIFIADIVLLILWYVFHAAWVLPFFTIVLPSLAVAPTLVIAYLPVKMVVTDISKKTMHTEYRLFFMRFSGAEKTLPDIDYVSAFCQLQSDEDNSGNVDYSYVYDINLWYGNKHIKLCSQYTPEEALRMGKKLSIAFNCDLLDATRPNQKEWITPVKMHTI